MFNCDFYENNSIFFFAQSVFFFLKMLTTAKKTEFEPQKLFASHIPPMQIRIFQLYLSGLMSFYIRQKHELCWFQVLELKLRTLLTQDICLLGLVWIGISQKYENK